MKKLIITALVVYGAWQYYQNNFIHSTPSMVVSTPVRTPAPVVAPPSFSAQPSWATSSSASSSNSGFKCDGRQHCSQMRSKEEAYFFLQNCPNTKMDGDGDGIPCERQF